MKIAYITNFFPNLSQTFILDQITGMIDLGHDIQIYSNYSYSKYANVLHEEIHKYDLLSRVHYFNIPDNPFARMMSFIKVFVKYFYKKPALFLKTLNILDYGKFAYSLKLPHVIVHFWEEQFDIIHCHFGPPGNLGACLKQLGIKGKLITTFRGYDVDEGIEKGGHQYQKLFRQADLIIAISRYNRENVITFGALPEKVLYHPTGINLDKFKYIDRNFSNKPEKFIILTVARFVEKKALHVAIDAIQKFSHKYPDQNFEYRIIGYGPLEQSLKRQVQSANLEKIVRFLGALKENEVIQQMRESHVFMLSSIREGLGKSILEAQAIGLPVLGTDAGGIPEALQPKISGYIVPRNNSSALAQKLEDIYCNYPKWSDRGRARRKFIEDNYDLKQLNQKLETIYFDLFK